MISELIMLVLAAIFFFVALSKFGWVVLFINMVIALIVLKLLGWLGVRIRIDAFTLLFVVLGGIPAVVILAFLVLTGLGFKERR